MNRNVFPTQRWRKDIKNLKFNIEDYEDDCLPGCDAVQFGIRSVETSYSCLQGKGETG
jgi:hypothetical protein